MAHEYPQDGGSFFCRNVAMHLHTYKDVQKTSVSTPVKASGIRKKVYPKGFLLQLCAPPHPSVSGERNLLTILATVKCI
jgi:hypothetical protein